MAIVQYHWRSVALGVAACVFRVGVGPHLGQSTEREGPWEAPCAQPWHSRACPSLSYSRMQSRSESAELASVSGWPGSSIPNAGSSKSLVRATLHPQTTVLCLSLVSYIEEVCLFEAEVKGSSL